MKKGRQQEGFAGVAGVTHEEAVVFTCKLKKYIAIYLSFKIYSILGQLVGKKLNYSRTFQGFII